MKIIDEIMPKIKAEARLDKDNQTLWIKADTLDGYDRIIIENGSNWCRIFYEDCGECAHNKAEQTEPQTDCGTCKHHYGKEHYDIDCERLAFGSECRYEPQQTDCQWK